MRIEEVKQWLAAYFDEFRGQGELPPLLDLKRAHTLRVADNTREIATRLGWTAGDVALAEAVGLLHDVGRFPQYREHGTFSDARSVDHGDLGADVLARKYPWAGVSERIRETVLRSVRHHNEQTIPSHVPGHACPFLEVLRDGDKLDVFRVVREWDERGALRELFPTLLADVALSPYILECVARGSTAPYDRVRTLHDYHLVQLSWVYDLNYGPSLELLVSSGLLGWTEAKLASLPEAAPILSAVSEHVRQTLA